MLHNICLLSGIEQLQMTQVEIKATEKNVSISSFNRSQ